MKFGSTIRPELGRMDFSGIERGGRAYAEGVMRGSEQLGAGIRSAGASIGDAIQKYQENKAMDAALTGSIETSISFNPTTLAYLESQAENKTDIGKAYVNFKEGNATRADKMMLSGSLAAMDRMNQMAQKRMEAQQDQTNMLAAVRAWENAKPAGGSETSIPMFFENFAEFGGNDPEFAQEFIKIVEPEKDKVTQTFEQAKRTVKLSDGTEVPVVFDRASGKFKMTNKQGNVVDVPPDAEFIGEDQITQSEVNIQVLKALGDLGKTADQLTDEDITNYTDNPIIRGALIRARKEALRSEQQNMIFNFLNNSNNGNNNPDPLNINQ